MESLLKVTTGKYAKRKNPEEGGLRDRRRRRRETDNDRSGESLTPGVFVKSLMSPDWMEADEGGEEGEQDKRHSGGEGRRKKKKGDGGLEICPLTISLFTFPPR